MYWNDEFLEVVPYERKAKHYFCGKELKKINEIKSEVYTILVLDYSECCCATVYTDGEIKIHFNETSQVPSKQKAGGQSAKRFSQLRDNEITKWFKEITRKYRKINKEVYLGISDVYKNRFYKYLNEEDKQKIREQRAVGYSGISGIYDYINRLEREKKNGI